MNWREHIAVAVVCICMILPTILIPIGFSLQNVNPRFYIKDFYVPALNRHTLQSNATINNTFVFFDLELRNVMIENSVRYGDLNLTLFFYGPNGDYIPIAKYKVPGFKQGNKKTDDWRDVVEAHGVPWDDAVKAVSNGSKVVFRVDLVTDVDLKQLFWSNKKKMVLEANVEVNDFGEKDYGKPIRLNSARPSGASLVLPI